MTVKQPSPIFRAFVLAAQGVFFNMFFLAYLLSPRTAHRFVGYLEEEACLTYTRCLSDMEKGWVPEWEDVQAPEIAIVSLRGGSSDVKKVNGKLNLGNFQTLCRTTGDLPRMRN